MAVSSRDVKKATGPAIGFVIALVVLLVVSGLTIANQISGDIITAVQASSGLLTIVLLFATLKAMN